MKASQFFVSTLKEAPADAEVVSHQLMVRAGFIKRLSAGIYTYMPMGLRVIRKIEEIVREEMNRAGAVELLMPVVQPAELWQESGRFQKYGPELMRVKDRHERDFVIQPTSEEVITDIARQELRSYRALPKNFYHIQTKFRDERRPRFGVMRGREFTMKDAYSFDRDLDAARISYDLMYAAYVRIFERMGLVFRAVAADNGAIGGIRSHEFQVIADTGEDAIVYSTGSDYAANIELAEAVAPAAAARRSCPAAREDADAGQEHVRGRRRAARPAARADREVDRARHRRDRRRRSAARRADDLAAARARRPFAERDQGEQGRGPRSRLSLRDRGRDRVDLRLPPGYLGPIEPRRPVRLVVDRAVAAMSDFVCGANAEDFHYTGVNWGRDLPEPDVVADIRNVVAGDPSPDGKRRARDPARHRGRPRVPARLVLQQEHERDLPRREGHSRSCCRWAATASASRASSAPPIEQNHDERGMIWPQAIAPFAVVVCPIGYDRSAEVRDAADRLHAALVDAGVDVILDDRGERPGAMFADWELIGVPHRVVLSDRGLKAGTVEYQGRRDAAPTSVAVNDVLAFVKGKLAA